MCLWKIRRVPSPSSWQIMDSWNRLTQVFQSQYFLHSFAPSKTSDDASPCLTQLFQAAGPPSFHSTSALPQPVWWQRGLTLPYYISPLWGLLLSLQEAGCIHRKAQHRSENQPKPLPAVGFTFLRVRVISTAFEFLPSLGSKEKPVPTGPFFFFF